MNIGSVVAGLGGCPCGKSHTVQIKAVEIAPGLLTRCPAILAENGFPRRILVVADKNALTASDGIPEALKHGGFEIETKIYDDLRVAEAQFAAEVADLAKACGGILSVGSGSCNDVCRRAALLADREFAIFATAPSMDGFASGTAPITDRNFKATLPARQPSIIIGDTEILSKAPAALKTAGFGDVLAKYVALTDWRVSHLLTGEYYCEKIAALVRGTVAKMAALADRITADDPETAGVIMEALVWSGLAMKLADSVRPASGTEHVLSHYWEIKKLEKGLLSDFHGRKVGVATLFAARIYHEIIRRETVTFHPDATDWEKVFAAYGSAFRGDVEKVNSPTVTAETTPERLRDNWEAIRRIVREELPAPEKIEDLLTRAGAAKTLADIDVSPDLGIEGLRWHPYMRHRMTLMRCLPMTDLTPDYAAAIRD